MGQSFFFLVSIASIQLAGRRRFMAPVQVPQLISRQSKAIDLGFLLHFRSFQKLKRQLAPNTWSTCSSLPKRNTWILVFKAMEESQISRAPSILRCCRPLNHRQPKIHFPTPTKCCRVRRKGGNRAICFPPFVMLRVGKKTLITLGKIGFSQLTKGVRPGPRSGQILGNASTE